MKIGWDMEMEPALEETIARKLGIFRREFVWKFIIPSLPEFWVSSHAQKAEYRSSP